MDYYIPLKTGKLQMRMNPPKLTEEEFHRMLQKSRDNRDVPKLEGTGKPNPWIEHVRAFAKKNNMTYGCALSNPKVKVGYVPKSKKVLNPLRKEKPRKKKLVVVEPKKKLEMPEEVGKLIQDFARPAKRLERKKIHAEYMKKLKEVDDIMDALDVRTRADIMNAEQPWSSIRGKAKRLNLPSPEKLYTELIELENEVERLNKPLLVYDLQRGFFESDRGKVRFVVEGSYGKYKVVYYDEDGKTVDDFVWSPRSKLAKEAGGYEPANAYQQLFGVLRRFYKYKAVTGIGITINELIKILPNLEEYF